MTLKSISMSGLSPRTTRRAAVALLTLLSSAACGTEEAPDALAPTGALGRVRFVNLITDPARNPVNALLESLPFGVNLAYGGTTPSSLPAPATATYSSILAGPRTLVLKRTADTSVTVATINFTVVEGQDRTVYATGGTGGAAVTSLITLDANPVPATGQSTLRIVNMTTGPVDVFVTASGADLATATPAVTNLAPQSGSAPITLAAGTYQIRFVPAGTAPASRAGAVSLTVTSGAANSPTLALAAGAARTVVAAPSTSGGAPLRAFVLTDR
ncbi:MAG TPA: DUF4397 domain-containing protein [Gemmatimonadaceae bacterium]|nr:DUF4397 domain-containing protein [Gemmatimonadaceae bacterium]